MTFKFTAQVDAFATATKKRCDALARASTLEVIEDAQMPKAKGGRMPVDTGFLRNSGQVSFTGMPSGPDRGARDGAYGWSPAAAEAELAKVEAGSTIYFGWTALYAKYREPFDNFMLGAVQQWPQIVDRVARRIWWNSPAGGNQ